MNDIEKDHSPSEVASTPDPSDRPASESNQAVRELEVYVEQGSDALERALDRHFGRPTTDKTFEVMRDAGMLVVGEDGFSLIVWIASRPEPRKALEAFDFTPVAEAWLRGFMAAYGGDIRRALHLSDVLASRRDDWESFGSSIRIDPRTGDYEITTEVQKFDGTKLVLQAGLPSAVRLAAEAIGTVLKVPSLDSVEDRDRAELLEVVETLRKKLISEKAPEEETAESEAGSTPGGQ